MAETGTETIEETVPADKVAALEEDLKLPSAPDQPASTPTGHPQTDAVLGRALDTLDASQQDAAHRFLHGSGDRTEKRDTPAQDEPVASSNETQIPGIPPYLTAALNRLEKSGKTAVREMLYGKKPAEAPPASTNTAGKSTPTAKE